MGNFMMDIIQHLSGIQIDSNVLAALITVAGTIVSILLREWFDARKRRPQSEKRKQPDQQYFRIPASIKRLRNSRKFQR